MTPNMVIASLVGLWLYLHAVQCEIDQVSAFVLPVILIAEVNNYVFYIRSR